MKRWFVRSGLAFVVLLAVLAAPAALWDRPRSTDYPVVVRDDFEIIRDDWGVPLVRGETDPAVAYGVALAHAEDDFGTIQRQLLATRSRLGSVDGIEGAKLDFLAEVLQVKRVVSQNYGARLDDETRAYVEAYADGLNRFAAEHGDEVLRADLFPVRGEDIVGGFVLTSPLFFGLDMVIGALVSGELPPGYAAPETERGSNAFVIAPSRSEDGLTHLVANSHQPWSGPVAWYELRVESGEGWRFYGATFPGAPLPLHGHNAHLGWTNTINRPDLIDVYALELSPDGDSYRFGGDWLELDKERIFLRVRFGPFTLPVPRTLYGSVHGPVFKSEAGAFAVRWPGMDEVRQVQQYLELAKASDWQAWRSALALQAVPATNFVYADKEGNIALVYNAAFPDRPAGYDWRGVLPGHDPAALWTGILPFDRVPVLLNPPSGYIVSANNTPFLATAPEDDLEPGDFDPRLGIEANVTNRILRALRLFEADDSLSEAELEAIKYDTGYEPDSPLGRQLRQVTALTPEDARLAEAVELLNTWDWRQDGEGRADALAALVMKPFNGANYRGTPPPNPEEVLREAVSHLEENFGTLEVSLEDLLRLRRGELDLPLKGGHDALRAVGWEVAPDGRLVADFGDSFVMFVAWEEGGVVSSRSVQPYGSAVEDEGSLHYHDQARLFSSMKTKPTGF